MFDKPAPREESGDNFDQKAHVGALLVIKVHKYEPSVVTKFSPNGTEAVKADVYVIGADATVTGEYVNTLLFGKVLCGQLRQSEGRTVVGILGLGEAGAGKNAPYVFDEAPPAAEEAAVRAMTSKPAPAQVPAQQAQPAAAAPWGAQPATVAAGVPAPPWGQ